MAGKIRVDLHSAGVLEVLRSEGVQADLRRRGNAIAAAAGEGHDVDVFVGKDRARAHISTRTAKAKRAEMRDRTLTRALDAGRDG